MLASPLRLFAQQEEHKPGGEANLKLLYFNGTIWVQAKTSGGVAPAKNTTDNLDGTTSGGRLSITFDNTSTPKITELTGTPFVLTDPDTTPPVINCPASLGSNQLPIGGI